MNIYDIETNKLRNIKLNGLSVKTFKTNKEIVVVYTENLKMIIYDT